MKPLLSIVVTICVVVATIALPENIEDVKQLPQTKEPVVEAAEGQNHPRIERCSACSAKLHLNQPNFAAFQQGEVHTSQSFEGCTSESGCAGIKVKDGKIVEKFGNLEAFENAAASNTANEFQFFTVNNLKSFLEKGITSDAPFWWMNQNSPFKTSGFQKYTSKNSAYTSSSGNGGLSENIFLNGQFSKGAGFNSGSTGFSSGSAGSDSAAAGFNSGSGSVNFLNGQIGSGYTGSSPRPFTASTVGSNINLIQTSQKEYSQGGSIDGIYAGSGHLRPNENAGELQSCASQGYVCVLRSQCNNGVVSGGVLPQAISQKQYCNSRTEICCRLEATNTGSFQSNSVFNSGSSIDAFGAGSGISETYRPGASGSNLKPGIPYLPPVDSSNSASNIVSSTPFPTPTFVTTSRPFNTPRPVSPSGYLPPTSTSAPGYLPPENQESTNTKETYIPPSPNYNSGELILDTFIPRPSSPRPSIPQAPSEIPAGCAAALKCTPIEYCTAEGVISNTTVVLTRDQASYRVPLTDCKDVETGRIGKCCRDPYYTDPWPVNQLGKWVPGVFGGNDGKYVPDSRGSSSDNNRPSVTVKPPTTGSVYLNVNRQSPTPITPSRIPDVTPRPNYQSTPGSGAYIQSGQGSYLQGGRGQYTQGGEGSYQQQGVGQFGVGGIGVQRVEGAGQAGIGQQGTFGAGQQATVGIGGRGEIGAGGVGGIQDSVGQGSFGGFGTAVNQGQYGVGTQGTYEQGTGVIKGQGKQITTGSGQIGVVGQSALVTQGVGGGVSYEQAYNNQGLGTNAYPSRGFGQSSTGYGQSGLGYGQNGAGYGQSGPGYGQSGLGYGQSGRGYGQSGRGYGQGGTEFGQNGFANRVTPRPSPPVNTVPFGVGPSQVRPTPRPVAPRPIAPRPIVPRPLARRPITPRPVAPVTPRPFIPRPVIPQPVTPRPVAPRPVVVQRPVQVAPRPFPVTPRPIPVAPRPAPVAPRPFPVAPRPVSIAPRPVSIAPRPVPVAPRPIPVVPRPIPVAPRPIPVAPRPIPVAPRPVAIVPRPIVPRPVASTPVVPRPVIRQPVTPRPVIPRPVIPQSVPRPVPQPIPRPLPQPVARPLPQPAPRPLPQPVPRPISQPIPRPLPQPVPRPISQPIPRPIPQPTTPRPIAPRPIPVPIAPIIPAISTPGYGVVSQPGRDQSAFDTNQDFGQDPYQSGFGTQSGTADTQGFNQGSTTQAPGIDTGFATDQGNIDNAGSFGQDTDTQIGTEFGVADQDFDQAGFDVNTGVGTQDINQGGVTNDIGIQNSGGFSDAGFETDSSVVGNVGQEFDDQGFSLGGVGTGFDVNQADFGSQDNSEEFGDLGQGSVATQGTGFGTDVSGTGGFVDQGLGSQGGATDLASLGGAFDQSAFGTQGGTDVSEAGGYNDQSNFGGSGLVENDFAAGTANQGGFENQEGIGIQGDTAGIFGSQGRAGSGFGSQGGAGGGGFGAQGAANRPGFANQGGLGAQGGGGQGFGNQGGLGGNFAQGGGGFGNQVAGQFGARGGGFNGFARLVRGEGVKYGQGFYQRQKEGVISQQGTGQDVIQGIGTGVKTGQGVQYKTGGGFGVEYETGETINRVFLQRYSSGGECGLLNPQKPYGNKNDLEVDFAEIPWQAMVLLQTNKSLLCGGVITRPDVVITSASCVDGLEAKNVLIKGGEWKLGIDDEPLPFQIVQVKHILRHPFYKPGTFKYDAAILVLTENLRLAKNIYPICLPSKESSSLDAFYNGAGECLVTGWGKSVLQSHLQGSIMHALNVSLLNSGECQSKLTSDYPHLLEYYDSESCVCGQPTNPLNNICKVDIGSALGCTTDNSHFVLRGLYSWDSGCQVGNQIAAFYKFDIEWYEWALGFIESVRFARYGIGTKVTQTKYTTKVTGVKTQYTTGIKGIGVSGSSGVSGVSGVSGINGVGGGSGVSRVTNVGGSTGGFGTDYTGSGIGGGVKNTGGFTSGGTVTNGVTKEYTTGIGGSNGFGGTITSGVTKEISGGGGGFGVQGFGGTVTTGVTKEISGGRGVFGIKGFGGTVTSGVRKEISGGGGVFGVKGFGGTVTSGGTNEISGNTGVFGVKGFGEAGNGLTGISGQGGQFASQFSGTSSSQFGKFNQVNTGDANLAGLNFGSDIKGPISNGYTATFTEKKVFQSEPKYVTYTTKPEIVTFTTKPEYFTFTTKPKYVTYTTKPEIITYTTKPEIVTFTTKPKIVTYTTKPKLVTYTTRPQIITYETSGSGTNPQYIAPNVTFNPNFSEVVGHKHTGQCKCLENQGKK